MKYIVIHVIYDKIYKISYIKAKSLLELSDKINDTITYEDMERCNRDPGHCIRFAELVKLDETTFQTNINFNMDEMDDYMNI